MCDYCKNVITGDDYRPLFNIPIHISIGKQQAEIGEIDVFLDTAANLQANLMVGGCDKSIEYIKKIPVKFCPMCGQSMKEMKQMQELRKKENI